ncbi:hypothetical protein ES703_62001 [subsurface metagenome]
MRSSRSSLTFFSSGIVAPAIKKSGVGGRPRVLPLFTAIICCLFMSRLRHQLTSLTGIWRRIAKSDLVIPRGFLCRSSRMCSPRWSRFGMKGEGCTICQCLRYSFSSFSIGKPAYILKPIYNYLIQTQDLVGFPLGALGRLSSSTAFSALLDCAVGAVKPKEAVSSPIPVPLQLIAGYLHQ